MRRYHSDPEFRRRMIDMAKQWQRENRPWLREYSKTKKQKAHRDKYKKEWRVKNKQKLAKYNHDYYQKKKQEREKLKEYLKKLTVTVADIGTYIKDGQLTKRD